MNLTIQNIIEVNNSQNVEILGKFLTSVAKQKFLLLKIFQFHFNFCSGILVKHLTRGLVQLLQSFSLWWIRPLLLNIHEAPMAFDAWELHGLCSDHHPTLDKHKKHSDYICWEHQPLKNIMMLFMQELAVVLSKFGRAFMHKDKIGVASDWFQSGFNMPGPSVLQIKSSSIKWHYVLNR